MSDTSPRLALPLIAPSQAQKHVTHNEAVILLDGLVQLTLQGVGALTPPGAGADGEAYGLGSAPTGLWDGRGGHVAIRAGGGWVFAMPAEGWRAWDLAAGRALRHDGTGWIPDLADLSNLDGVGIGAGFDATNRLSVASDAVLLSHAGAGMQLKVNKAGPGETASLLFQSGFSGRAEMGLAGSDAFEVKVSPDGAAWTSALRLDPGGRLEAPGGVSLGAGGSVLGAYEEGTWTPVLTSATPATGTVQTGTGRYVRIGQLVQLDLYVELSGPGTGGSGETRIAGLPAAGSGLCAGSQEHGVFAMSTGNGLLRADGTDLVLGRSFDPVDWSAMVAGSWLAAQVSYLAS